MRTGIVSALLVVLALAWFNPDMADFRQFVRLESSDILLEETGDSEIGRALSGLGSQLAGSYVDRITTRRNYFLFSSYTVKLGGEESEEDEWRFIGFAAHFFETNRPEFLEK